MSDFAIRLALAFPVAAEVTAERLAEIRRLAAEAEAERQARDFNPDLDMLRDLD